MGEDLADGARVVGEEEAQGLHGQELVVDGDDLVGKRLDEGGVDGEHRVEEVGEPDALSLGGELEEVTVAVEAPAGAGGDDVEAGGAGEGRGGRWRRHARATHH
ncbi:MAG: hypothetical protein ACRD2Z_13515 [Thermoanaerobaculia bacterium]